MPFVLTSLSRLFAILLVSFALIGCGEKDASNEVIAAAAGGYHSLALTSDGKVYAAGQNHSGQLGVGDKTDRDRFTKVSSLKSKAIIAVAAGYRYSLALDEDGKVYAAGQNDFGQLGVGDKTDRDRFVAANGKNITAIAAGGSHSLALARDGKVYAAGHNKYGQLGLGDTADRDQFIEVSSLKGKQIVAIAAGYAYSLALDEDGKVYAAGHNDYSQLGLGDRTNRDQFVEVSSLERKKIAAISAGDAYSLALAKDGKLYAAGNNSTGFLGLDYKTNPDKFAAVPLFSYKNIIAVAAGDSYSLAIVKDGKLYATTYNGAGHLKISESEDDVSERDRFVAVSSLERKTIIAVAAAYNHSLAVAGDGKIYAIGFNDYGQLGLGDTADRDEFAAVEFNPATAR